MNQIQFFLEKFRNLVPVDQELKILVQQAVKKHTGHDLPMGDISVQKWTVYVKTKPGLKSEMLIKQEAIMGELEKVLKNRVPRKIV